MGYVNEGFKPWVKFNLRAKGIFPEVIKSQYCNFTCRPNIDNNNIIWLCFCVIQEYIALAITISDSSLTRPILS